MLRSDFHSNRCGSSCMPEDPTYAQGECGCICHEVPPGQLAILDEHVADFVKDNDRLPTHHELIELFEERAAEEADTELGDKIVALLGSLIDLDPASDVVMAGQER